MSNAIATIENAGVQVDHQAILKSLNLNPRDPNTQALLLVCERYALDPLLKHMVLISGNPYITRDGYLAIAHRSGVFDGMEVLEQGADTTHFTAKVAVYRKDMGRPFTFIGRYPKAQRMAKEYGPEMAVKVAEVQALRRAFNVTGVPAADERWDEEAVSSRVEADVPPPAQQHVEHTRPREMDVVTDTKPLPAELPPSTGARKRRAPTGAGGVGVAPEAPPRAEPAPPELVDQVTDVINALKEAGDEWAERGREAWKAAGLPSTGAGRLSKRDAEVAFDVLAAVLRDVPAPTLDGGEAA